MRTSLVVSIVSFTIGAMITLVLIAIGIDCSKTDSWLMRAKAAGNPKQVEEFLTNYKNDLNLHGLVEGKYLSFWERPGDSMSVYVRTIDGLIARADDLSKQSPTDTSYQMGLVNLEKDLSDIRTAAWAVFMAGAGFYLTLIMLISYLVFLVSIIV